MLIFMLQSFESIVKDDVRLWVPCGDLNNGLFSFCVCHILVSLELTVKFRNWKIITIEEGGQCMGIPAMGARI